MAEKKKAEYAPPASQVDLEARLANGNSSDRVLSTSDAYVEKAREAADANDGRDYRVEGNKTDEYVGTSPEYATYANDTEKPLASDDKSPEAQVFQNFADNLNTQPVETSSYANGTPKESDDEDDEDEVEPSSQPTTPQTASTTGSK